MLFGTDVFLLFAGPKLVCQPFHLFLKVLHSPFENHFIYLILLKIFDVQIFLVQFTLEIFDQTLKTLIGFFERLYLKFLLVLLAIRDGPLILNKFP